MKRVQKKTLVQLWSKKYDTLVMENTSFVICSNLDSAKSWNSRLSLAKISTYLRHLDVKQFACENVLNSEHSRFVVFSGTKSK